MRLAAVMTFATLGCRNDAPPQDKRPVDVPTLAAVNSDGSMPAIDARPPTTILIRDDGVGPITAKSTIRDLENAFPDLERDSERRHDPMRKRELEHTWFSRNGQFVMMVITDPARAGAPVVEVKVGDPSVVTAERARTTQTIGQLATTYPDLVCTFARVQPTPSTELVSISCVTKELPHVSFSPAVDRADYAPGVIPIGTLAERTIDTIVWRP